VVIVINRDKYTYNWLESRIEAAILPTLQKNHRSKVNVVINQLSEIHPRFMALLFSLFNGDSLIHFFNINLLGSSNSLLRGANINLIRLVPSDLLVDQS